MAGKGKEIIEELRMMVSGKTLDALLPPLVFALVNGMLGLYMAVAAALVLILSYVYGIWRLHSLGGPGVDEFQKTSHHPGEGRCEVFDSCLNGFAKAFHLL